MWSLLVYPNHYKKILLFVPIQYKNEWKKRKFWRQSNKKSYFYKNKKVSKIDDIDVNKILIYKEEPYSTKSPFKYFIGYNNNDAIRPLCMKLPQTIGYVRKCEGNATMSFKINDDELLKKYNQTWKKVEKLLRIELDSKPIYGDNDKYIKQK